MGASRQVVDYSTMSVEQLCTLWDMAQRQQSELLTTELLEEFQKRSERPAPTVHNLPWWLCWLPRLFWRQKPANTVGEGRGYLLR